MAAYRYWRVVGLLPRGAGDLALSALYLCGASGRADAAATLSCSHAPLAGSLGALQDGDGTTHCRFAAADVRSPGFWIRWDFGAGGADITSLQLGGADSAEVFLARCDVQGSADGVGWTTLSSVSGIYKWPGANTLGEVSDGDPLFPNVSLLLHCDGDDGSTTVVDSSSVGNAVAMSGGCKLSASTYKFGTAALDCTAAGAMASVAAGSGFDFGGAPFTFEAQVFPLNVLSTAHVMGRWGNSGGCAWHVGLYGTAVFAELSGSGVYQPAYSAISGDGVVSANRWMHLAVCVRPGVGMDVFCDGVLVLALAAPSSIAAVSEPFTIGRNSAGQQFSGYIDEVRVTKGVAVYLSAFTPPTGPFREGGAPRDAQPADTVRALPLVAASAAVPSHSVAVDGLLRVCDLEHGGAGRIFGTTKAKGSPANLPTKARVVLLHQRSKLPVREVWSDPITGDFAFEGIDTRQEFLTLAEDAAGSFRPVAASRLAPEVAP